MPDLGWQELSIILVIVVVIFGAGKLPEIGGALGKSIKEFKANSEGIGGKIGAGSDAKAGAADGKVVAAGSLGELRADEI